jgi:hypothetical protein
VEKMKNFYFAVTIQANKKYYSYVIKLHQGVNIISRLKIPGIVSANIFPTKKEAAAVVERWNATYKANNNYLFDETF